MTIDFSITIPAFKSPFLKECIDSILSQTYKDFELIIVNDASPENLGNIVNAYTDPRIRYYVNEKNCGAINVVDNWNKCLEYAKGKFIICMGDDDKLMPNCLEEYSKLISKYPGLGVYHAWTEIIDENSTFLKLQEPRPEYEGCLCMAYNRWQGRSQYIGDFCFDVEKLRNDGGFFKLPMAWASDDITVVRAARYGGIANTQTLCFQYRQNKATISSVGALNIKMDATLLEKKWYMDFVRSYIPADEIEKKYLKVLSIDIEQHFKVKYKLHMTQDMTCHFFRLFYWLKHKEKYGLSTLRVLLAFINSLEARFHGK